MNHVPPHSGSRWEPLSSTARQAPDDLAPTSATATQRIHLRDRRRRGPRAVLLALLALLVLSVSGVWVAWGGQLRQLAQPDAPAAPASDQGGGFQPGSTDEPGDQAGELGPRRQGDRAAPDGDQPRDGWVQHSDDDRRGDDREHGDDGGHGDDETSDNSHGTEGGS